MNSSMQRARESNQAGRIFRMIAHFFKKLSTAVKYKPRLGWKKGCRLYLYILFAMSQP